jgi:hypothetical protein
MHGMTLKKLVGNEKIAPMTYLAKMAHEAI